MFDQTLLMSCRLFQESKSFSNTDFKCYWLSYRLCELQSPNNHVKSLLFCCWQKVTLQSGLFEKNDSTSPIGDDFRPVQPLNSRQITRPPGCNGAPSSFPSLSTNLLTIAVISVVTHCFWCLRFYSVAMRLCKLGISNDSFSDTQHLMNS